MKNRFIATFVLLSLCALARVAKAENYWGTWQGKPYDFYFSENSNNIYGHWGDERSDFSVAPNSRNIYGNIAGAQVDFYVTQNTKNAYGTLPCGKADFSYRPNSLNIYGNVCGNSFDITTTEQDFITTIEDLYLSEIEKPFPAPIRLMIRRFIQKRIQP